MNERLLPVLFGFMCATMVTASYGADFTFDENGNGSSTSGLLPGFLAPDPTAGVAGNVLIYSLPFQVVPGNVLILESGQSNAPASDLIRFFNTVGGQGGVIFYSDNQESPLDLADSGLPDLGPNPPTLETLFETGPEGNNGAPYIATFGATGSAVSGFGPIVTYAFVSDAPEPRSTALLFGGLVGFFAVRFFRGRGISPGPA